MKPVVAVVAPGNMGAGVARRLTDNGVTVLTTLEGRSPASRDRAAKARMTGVALDALAGANIVLSILPPANALEFARVVSPALQAARDKPLFVDCNAVNPSTVRQIYGVVVKTGADFVDAGIIGFPPEPGAKPGPHIYSSGEHASRLLVLAEYGLDIRVLNGPIGAASALKMSYAGFNKGSVAIFAAMILAAERAGSAEALRQELAEADPEILAMMADKVPRMFSKAYRWVAEMEEIAEFAREDPAAYEIWMGMKKLYERLARDFTGEQQEIDALKHFFRVP